MVRVLLAQISYKPAISDRGVDYLAEPAIVNHDISTAALEDIILPNEQEKLQLLRSDIRDKYVVYIRQKLTQLCLQADRICAPDIMVFPEYSVPYQCLPQLYRISNELGMTIIAGSHTVLESAEEYYIQAGLPQTLAKEYGGFSICPVFIPKSQPDFQVKNHRSNYEMSMCEPEESTLKRFVAPNRRGEPICFSVLLCADAIAPDVVGKISAPSDCDNGLMAFVVADSPRTDTFRATSQLFATNGVATLLCNHSQYGGSGIYLPDEIRNRFANVPGDASFLNEGEEMLMVLDLEQEHFFVKRAILDSKVLGSFCECPIIYGENAIWQRDHHYILQEIKTCIAQKNSDEAVSWAEYFTETYTSQLPQQLLSAFEKFQRRLSDGNISHERCVVSLEAAILKLHSTDAQFYYELQQAIDFCTKLYNIPSQSIAQWGEQRKKYPEAPLAPVIPIMPTSILREEPTEEQVSSFRDRGSFMTALERAVSDKTIKLILISGAYGVGKTSAIDVTFKRNLIDWDKRMILLQGVRFSTALEYMAEIIGDPLRSDTLVRQTKKVLKPIISNFVKRLLAKGGRVIVVDQMETILLEMRPKDATLLTLFREAICATQEGEGKIVFVSDIPFPKTIFPDNPSISRIVLGRIPDRRYVTRILNYEIRKHELVAKGNEPEIPEYVYDLVNGHPLTAKLCIDVASQHGMQSIGDISRDQLQSEIVNQLMEKISIGNVQTQLMCLLSVFRTAINTDTLLRHLSGEHQKLLEEGRAELDKLSFISVWPDRIELTAVFRSYFYDQIPEQMRDTYHDYAFRYYHELFETMKRDNKFSAVIYTEIAYHLTCLHRMDELKSYLPGNVNALKNTAKDIYQKKNYSEALALYRILDTAYPEDTEILSYLGRCYARDNDWEYADRHFEMAIAAAKKREEETWYLYRDWGHMNIRSHMDEEAKEHFAMARKLIEEETGREDDAGILAAEGYALEQLGDIIGAREKYEAALSYNYCHEFTISRYSQILHNCGEEREAIKLQQRLAYSDYRQTGERGEEHLLSFDFIEYEDYEFED